MNPMLFALDLLAAAPKAPAPAGAAIPGWLIAAAVGGAIVALIVILVFASYGSLWLKALLSNCRVSIPTIIGMRFRGVNPHTIVDATIMATKAGLSPNTDFLEAHFLAGGRVLNVVKAMVSAAKAKIHLPWEQAFAIDLAGRDVLRAVQMSVYPEVIDCPDPSRGTTIDAVAQDGIQLKARARVTVRTNIDRLVGGATQETIIARVGEGIVTTIGSSASYKQVLENPDRISKSVLQKGLDAGTAFEILSIDIADVDVGDNIGARLEADRAEADMRIARAKAEERRAMAAAREQEMVALVQENRAKVVLAEAEVPQAIAQALREGNLGVMDYLSLKNVQSDTDMRAAISGRTGPKLEGKKGADL